MYCIRLVTPKCPLRPHARGALGIFGCYATHLPLTLPLPYTSSLCANVYLCGSIQSDLDSGAAVAAKRHGKKPWFSVMAQLGALKESRCTRSADFVAPHQLWG